MSDSALTFVVYGYVPDAFGDIREAEVIRAIAWVGIPAALATALANAASPEQASLCKAVTRVMVSDQSGAYVGFWESFKGWQPLK